MKIKVKNMKHLTLILAVFALISFKVNAISVASDYLVNDTLELISGTSKIYSIRLQNPTDKEAGIKLDYDSTFMRARNYQNKYTLPPKTSGYRIEFNITAPKEPGLYRIGYTVSEVEPAENSGLPLRLKINKNFYLRAIEGSKMPEDLNMPNASHAVPSNYSGLVYAAILILIIFLFFIWKSSLKSKRNRKVIK